MAKKYLPQYKDQNGVMQTLDVIAKYDALRRQIDTTYVDLASNQIITGIKNFAVRPTLLMNNPDIESSPFVVENDLADVAFSGDYADLINLPTPVVPGNGTLTLNSNSNQLGTFSANQTTNITVDVSDFFYCTYDADGNGTTVTEITDAIAAHKIPVCWYNSHLFVYSGTNGDYLYFGYTTNRSAYIVRIKTADNKWSYDYDTFELQHYKRPDKTTTNGGWGKKSAANVNNNYYPSEKLVYDTLVNIIQTATGNGNAITSITSTTNADNDPIINVVKGITFLTSSDEYIKSASVGNGAGGTAAPNNKLTLTKQDNTTVDYEPIYPKLQSLISTDDLNNFKTAGIWYTVSSAVIAGMSNKPSGISGGECMLEVRPLGDTRYTYQIFTWKSGTTKAIYCRIQNNGTWGSWTTQPVGPTTTPTTDRFVTWGTSGRDLKDSGYSATSFEAKFTDGSANIASLSNSIVTLKAGVVQTDGAIANSTDTDITLAKVAYTGAYSDLSGGPDIPTVNDAILTVQQNSVSLGTFSANASQDVTVNVITPQVLRLL